MRRALSVGVLLLSACSRDPERCRDWREPYYFAGECVRGLDAGVAIVGWILAAAVAAWLIAVFVQIRNEAKRGADAAEEGRKLLAELRDLIGRDD